jgi:hypothetical protein
MYGECIENVLTTPRVINESVGYHPLKPLARDVDHAERENDLGDKSVHVNTHILLSALQRVHMWCGEYIYTLSRCGACAVYRSQVQKAESDISINRAHSPVTRFY